MTILYFYLKYSTKKEGFTSGKARCPNILIQKGSKIYLYNSKLAQVPGVNPVEFNNLEDYTQFLDWQRSQGIRCPVLYLQQSFDVHGNRVYKMRPNIYDPQSGLPPVTTPSIASLGPTIYETELAHTPPPTTLLTDSGRNDYPYNDNSYPSFDPSSFYVGAETPLDKPAFKPSEISPNPMDENWGGADYTQKLVDEGYYEDNEVSIYVP